MTTTTTNPFGTKPFEDKMSGARAAVIKKAPYFSSVVYGFVYRAIEDIRTMCVTPNMILGYDPKWAGVATIDELAADIVHEIHHFKSKHFERAKDFEDKDRFNKAGDLAINPALKKAGWKLSTDKVMGAIFPEHFGLPDGLTTEKYYELLKDKEGGGHGVCSGGCGGVAGGADHPMLVALTALPNVGRTANQQKSIEKRMANDIKKHIEQQGRGSLPGHLLDWTKVFDEEPHVRWEDELAQVLRENTGELQAGGDDFSLRCPSKRSILRGFPRPGLVEYAPVVAIIRDSSGSMQQPQLTAATREAYFILQALGIEEVWFCDADTDVATPWKRVGGTFFKTLTEVHGRGGTDFRAAIESALKLSPRPDLIVYLTDGDGTTTDMPPPNVSVVWGIVPSYYNMAPADWGHCVIISDDKNVRKKKVLRPRGKKGFQAVVAAVQAASAASLTDDDSDDDDDADEDLVD
jgi:predicted metal-dependent peptidase